MRNHVPAKGSVFLTLFRLQSKPELNGAELNTSLLEPCAAREMLLRGRYGFVDEFLRENERYRIFVPVACHQSKIKWDDRTKMALHKENVAYTLDK